MLFGGDVARDRPAADGTTGLFEAQGGAARAELWRVVNGADPSKRRGNVEMETIRWPVASPTEGAERVAGSAGLSPTGDMQCLGGAATTGEPGALLRGGSFGLQAAAGPLMISGFEAPIAFNSVGFRCAR